VNGVASEAERLGAEKAWQRHNVPRCPLFRSSTFREMSLPLSLGNVSLQLFVRCSSMCLGGTTQLLYSVLRWLSCTTADDLILPSYFPEGA